MPTPRRLLAAAVEKEGDGERIYTFGGCGSPCYAPPLHTSTFEERRVEVYDPKLDSPGSNPWSVRKPIPAIVFGAAAAAPGNGRIYLFGGFVTGNTVLEYNPNDDSWTAKTPMPTLRHGLAAVALGGKIYALGGSDGSAASNAFEIYDPETDTWTRGPRMPTARVFLAAAEVNGKIFAIGGSPDCCGKSRTAAVEIYDPETNRWTTGAPLPIALQTSAAASVNGKIYVFGGFIPGSGAQKTTLEYDPLADPAVNPEADPAKKPWSFKAEMRTARDQAPAVAIDDFIYVLGGSVDCHCRALGDNERYTPETTLRCTKDDDSESVVAGATVTYTIEVRNEGPEPAKLVRLADPETAGLTFVSAGPPCRGGFPCELGILNPDQVVSVSATFKAGEECADLEMVENVATVSAEGVPARVCSDSTRVVKGPPKLKCEKSGPLECVGAGEEVVYTVEVSNIGCRAARDVVLEDPTPPGLTLISVDPGCTKPPCALGTIARGGPASRTLKFRVLPECRETVINMADVKASNADDASCSVPTCLLHDVAVDVSFPVTVSPPLPFFGGGERDVSVLVSNAGPPTARGVVLEVNITGADAVTVVPPGCVPSAPGRFTCTIEEIKCGAAAKLDFRVRAPACTDCVIPEPITVSAEVKTADADPSNNQDSAAEGITCPLEGDLAISKDDVSDPVAPGDVLQYTLTVRNLGCADAAATVTDVFPPELTNILWCRDNGSPCTPNRPDTLQETISLPANGSATYRAIGIVTAMMCSGTLTNVAKVAGPPGFIDVHPEDNTSTEETTVAGTGVKALCKDISGANVEGGAITYTFVLLNCGPAVQMDNPGDEFSDPQPAGLTFVSAASSSGTATLGNPVTWNGSIPVGDMVTITIGATIDVGTAGTTICNQATIAFDADGDGTNESAGVSDDPNTPAPDDPCCFQVLCCAEFLIPALSVPGLLALALSLAALALLRLRRRSP